MIQNVIIRFENCNIEIDWRNFYDRPITDSITQCDEVRKESTGQSDDYTTGCLLDFAYFKNICRLIAADLSKKKALDADSRAIQQIVLTGKIEESVANARARILQRNSENVVTTYKWLMQ